ncbi:MAG: tetratricopeptide repeat protein [Ferruginibacter sp.]
MAIKVVDINPMINDLKDSPSSFDTCLHSISNHTVSETSVNVRLRFSQKLQKHFINLVCLSFLCFYSTVGISQNNASMIYLHKADSLFDAGNWKAAAGAYESGLKIDVSNGRVWYRLAEAYKAQGLLKEAIESYKKSLDLKTGVIPTGFIKASLAKAYSQNKDSTNVFRLLTEMVSNGYGNFPDLISSTEYGWLQSNEKFILIASKAKANAFPCMNNPQNREFDFWVGKWNVYQTGTNYQVGTSTIENTSGGCLILENWTAVGNPDEGKSMNFLNPKTAKWEQHYMGIAGASQNYYNGEYKDGAMRFEGDGVDKAGNKLLFRLSYFNEGFNQVRQLLEQSADIGKTWITLYDFTYKKRK